MPPEPTVWIVDDDPSIRNSLKWLIESIGLAVKTCHSAEEYLRVYVDGPGCLVTDLRMPGMSGLELQDALAATGCEVPVIFLTAHAEVPIAVRALKSGGLDFIEKPFSNQQLLDSIRRALSTDKVAREARARRAAATARLGALSTREQEVTNLVVEGKSNKQIAAGLELSIKTVEFHRAHIMRKMGADSLAALIHVVLIAKGLREP
jgi:two-component system, LuxR family, response regulator FixJ